MTSFDAHNAKVRLKIRKYDTKKIKSLLAADVKRFCKSKKVVNSFMNGFGSVDSFNQLRKIVGALKYGEETLYAAIVLALHNDASGISVLKSHQKYWSTSSEIEKLHVRAALVLLREAPAESLRILNTSLSPELAKLVQE